MSTCFLLNSVRDTGINGYSDCYITRHSLAQILVMFAYESFDTCLEEYCLSVAGTMQQYYRGGCPWGCGVWLSDPILTCHSGKNKH